MNQLRYSTHFVQVKGLSYLLKVLARNFVGETIQLYYVIWKYNGRLDILGEDALGECRERTQRM